MFFLLLLLATASCTVNAMDRKELSILNEFPEDFPEQDKNRRKLWIESLHRTNQKTRKIQEEKKNKPLSTTITQDNSNSEQQ
jgi:hypothetical protein